MSKSYKVIPVNSTPGNHHDRVTYSDVKYLEELLNEGWVIERETILSGSVSAPAYKGLSAVIYILSIDKV